MPDSEKDKAAESDLIQLALERFKLAEEAESAWRAEALDDLKFSTGDQWDQLALTARKGKPCLTMDQIQQSIRLVCNQYRQQPPAIEVNPVGDGADTDTAEIEQGIVRHIELNCDAQIIYETTHEQVVRTGFGSCRLLNDYKDETSEDQEIFIEAIRNQFSVYWQPGVPQEKAEWAFIVTDHPVPAYRDRYKDSELAKLGDGALSEFTGTGNNAATWVTKEYRRTAEYFTVEEITQGKDKRPKKKVTWRKINAIEVIDKRELPGTSIPIFTAYGDDLDVDGKRYVAGLVRNAKDPQRMYNYQCSEATAALALAPKAPWLTVEGSLSGRDEWNNPNAAVLQYKQIDVAGKPAPPPQRITVEPPIQAITLMIRQAALDLKAAMGIYDPSLGQRRGDESGLAIKQLQQQGSIATLNYADNMTRMLKRLGRTILEWIPKIFEVPRIQRIIKPDGTVDHVVTHVGPDQVEEANALLTDKIKKVFDIGTGTYDVAISIGPSYQSKRQEAVATQLDFLKLLPPPVAINFIDLVTANMDWPQAKEFSARAKKMLPPQLQDGDDTDPEVRAQKLQSQLSQMSQQHELLTAHLNDVTQQLNTKQVEQQGKVQIAAAQAQADMAIAKMKIDAQIAIAEITTKAQNESERLQMLKEIELELHGSAHDVALQAHQQLHEKDLAAQQAQQAQQSQQADQQHESDMAQQQEQPQEVGANQ
jgi:hypothetical protein